MRRFSTFHIERVIPRRAARAQKAQAGKCHKSTGTDSRSSDAVKEVTRRNGAVIISSTAIGRPLWQRLGPLSKTMGAYGRAQQRRPYFTQFCSSVVIYLCGDLAAQRIGSEQYEPNRTARNIIIGGICSVPSYKWYVPRIFELRR